MLNAACDAQDNAKLAPRIGVFCESDPVGAANIFHPVGCCITGYTLPGLSRAANVSDTCLTITDCADPTASSCDAAPNTEPGDMEESTLEFITNHAPGSTRTLWLQNGVKCGEKLRWRLCHTNGVQELIECAWPKSYVPDSADGSSSHVTATVTISICGDTTIV